MENCLFCDFVAGRKPCHKVWEDENHLAFLTIFPNTEGVTVVIPKQHVSSYAFAQTPEVLSDLTLAAQKVGKLLDNAFPDSSRTGMVYEGYGINHLHAKLFPLHGTKEESWKQRNSTLRTYFETYPGYISSHDGEQQSAEKLATLAERIRQA